MSYIKQLIHNHDIHSDKQLKEHLTRLNKFESNDKNLDILINLLLINYLTLTSDQQLIWRALTAFQPYTKHSQDIKISNRLSLAIVRRTLL